MSKQSKASTKKDLLQTEEMSLEKVDPLREVSDSETDSETEDFVDELENDSGTDSEDEIKRALNEAKDERKKREIKGFGTLNEKEWYEIRYLSDEHKSPSNKDNKVRVIVVQDTKRKNPVSFVYAPSIIRPDLIWEYLLGNGAYIQPLGKTKSLTSGHNYNNCKIKTLSKKRKNFSFEEEEAAVFAEKIEKALKALRKEKSNISNQITEKQRKIAELRAKMKSDKKKTKNSTD